MKTIIKNLRFSATAIRAAIILCLTTASVGTWAQTTPQPTPRYVGALGNTGRKINSISLSGTTTPQQTITCGDNSSYSNKTSEHFIIREGETSTATFTWNGSWMHGYIYIDKNQDGTYNNIALGTNGVPTTTSELVAYSAYEVNGTYRKSDGTTTNSNTTLNPPTFTAPTTAGIYYMRYKTDWNYIDPAGRTGNQNTSNSFQANSAVAIDVSLWVVKEYTLTIVNPRAGTSVSIDNATEAAYTMSGTVLSTNSALAVADIHATDSRNLPIDVTVSGTNITVTFSEYVIPKTYIASLDEITDKTAYYVLTQDCSAPSAAISGFTGTLDGGFHTISGATHALFDNLNGAMVKNVILDDVSISSGTNVGAIANEASGDARIYNCGVLATNGSTISGSGNVGSIVGTLSGNARVLNCFSYADVSGGTVGGIVGNNNGTAVNRNTILAGTGSIVFNCMFFGTVSGTNKYPVFGGNTIENVSGINTYNYFLYDGTAYTNVNSAAGVADKSLLNRFDMYRGILNSHRDLCAMYINNTQTIDNQMRHDIALWHYNPTQRETAPYLQLESCLTNTRRTLDHTIPNETEAYKGKQVGTVSCTFNINGRSYTETLPTTDMDVDNWDYTWGKIVLPFANEFSGWTLPASGSTAYDNIITGWEITSITGGTPGSWDGSYDLCNPDCTAKDLYANSNYVWAQGGNYVVPTGVTAITFTAHIVRCVYLADSYVDIAYNGAYTQATNLGTQLTGDTYNGKAVYHSLSTAFAQLEAKTNPADQAIVLVGNYHYNQAINADGLPAAAQTTSYSAKAVTIMSIDADNNQVPDYAFPQFHNIGSGRTNVPPLRFDFVCSPGIGISSYTRAGYLADVDILHAKGWFEVTETSMIHMTEFEIRPQNFTVNSPFILNGGIYDQFKQSSTNEYENSGNNDKLLYIRIGGKAYVKEFWPGHKQAAANMTINGKPINVSGGQIDQCYMNSDIHDKVINGDVNFYCNGGYIKEFLGAYQGRITGNMTTKVDHALIDAFYGGGSDNAYGTTPQIAGNIDNTINNSYVKFYCAGPKFGTMAEGKTVTTHATGTTFGEYYGAGYGGTALTKNLENGESPYYGDSDFTFDRNWSFYSNSRLNYNARFGMAVGYDFLFNMYAGGNHRGNCSIYVLYATLSLASTHNVSSTLINCTLEHDFYGGGCQGMVDGTITNSLTGCTVAGSVFGGGYKASATPIDVYPATQPTYAVFKAAEGLFTEFGTTEPEVYTWVQGTRNDVSDQTAKTISTTVDMAQMGKVTGEITTTVDGGTVSENVFGGGNESPSAASTKVEVKGTTTVGHDVYGGGNAAPVGASTDVLIDGTDVKIKGSVFGGGLGEPATVGTNTKVQLKDKVNVTNNVYGGGNGGAVEGNTEVIIGEQ